MILIVASSWSELVGVEQFPSIDGQRRSLPNGDMLVAIPIGVGKVQAALGTAKALETWKPSHLIGIGTCGAIRQDMEVGDIVCAGRVVQYDIDLRRFGLPRGSTFDSEGKEAGELVLQSPCLRMLHELREYRGRKIWERGVLGTADTFLVASERKDKPWIAEQLHVDAVDMESYAIVAAGLSCGIPVSIVRTVSDTWRGSRPKSYGKFLVSASQDMCALIAQYAEPSEKSPTIL